MTKSLARRATWCSALVSVIAACTAIAASGNSGKSEMTASGSRASTTPVDKVYAAYSHRITDWPGPNDKVTVTPGKKVTIITCGSTGITCVRVANGAVAAAKYLGYQATVVDGRQDPTVWNQAIQRAVADKSDGIILAAVPPVLVQGALEEAVAGNVKVAATLAPDGPGPVTRVNYDRTKVAQANAAFIAKTSGGNAHVLQLADYTDFPNLKQDGEAYAPLLKRYCSTCKVVKVLRFTAALAPQRLAGNVAQALQRDPSINYILVPFDTFNIFVIQGLRQAGKAGSVKIVGVGGDPPSVDSIKQGVQVESLGTPAEWMGWDAMDGLLRAWAGVNQPRLLKSPNSNYDVPMKYITKDNLPGRGGWKGDLDYKSKFKQLWTK